MTDLPIESELIDGEWYRSPRSGRIEQYPDEMSEAASGLRWIRMGPVAEYRPAPAEPTGLGAVVKVISSTWVRTAERRRPWRDKYGYHKAWCEFAQPVTVLSAGVEL